MRICIPIQSTTVTSLKNNFKKVQKIKINGGNLLVEIWLSKLSLSNEVQHLIKASSIPVIAVCKGKVEKGSYKGSEQDRINQLLEAITAGASYIDIGIHTAPYLIKQVKKSCQKYGAKLIISQHFWKKTPSVGELLKIEKKAQKLGADIVKIAAHVNKFSDNTILFEVSARLAEKKQPAIIIGMGEKGKISRMGCPLLGSYLTYVALDKKSRTAPGQLTSDELSSYW